MFYASSSGSKKELRKLYCIVINPYTWGWVWSNVQMHRERERERCEEERRPTCKCSDYMETWDTMAKASFKGMGDIEATPSSISPRPHLYRTLLFACKHHSIQCPYPLLYSTLCSYHMSTWMDEQVYAPMVWRKHTSQRKAKSKAMLSKDI